MSVLNIFFFFFMIGFLECGSKTQADQKIMFNDTASFKYAFKQNNEYIIIVVISYNN